MFKTIFTSWETHFAFNKILPSSNLSRKNLNDYILILKISFSEPSPSSVLTWPAWRQTGFASSAVQLSHRRPLLPFLEKHTFQGVYVYMCVCLHVYACAFYIHGLCPPPSFGEVIFLWMVILNFRHLIGVSAVNYSRAGFPNLCSVGFKPGKFCLGAGRGAALCILGHPAVSWVSTH